LYLCRRTDFKADGTSKSYRAGRIDLASLAFEYLTVDDPMQLALSPQPLPSETAFLFTNVRLINNKQAREIDQAPIPMGAAAIFRDKADAPVLSPDGTRYLYIDSAGGNLLHAANLDGSADVLVVSKNAGNAHYSPDGAKVVYLEWDSQAGCSHIET